MTTIRAFIKRYPVPSYFALVFAISWGGVLIVAAPGGITATPEQVQIEFPLVLSMMLVGPIVSGILLTGLVHGRAGLRESGSRLLRWRVGARWYVVALLTAPLLAMASLLAFLRFSPSFLPGIVASDDKASLLIVGITVGLGVGIFEELGWTGFAIPALRLSRGVLSTGLIVGLLWGVWHLAVYVWQSGTSSGALSLALFVPSVLFSVGVLVAFRVLMVWVYDRTGSLLVAILMHASLTGGVAWILMPPGISGVHLSTFYLVLTAALWVIVAGVAVANRGQLPQQPLWRRVT